MAIKDKIISFWKQVRLKSSDMFTLFRVGIGVKVPTHKLHIKDAKDPLKIEGLQNDSTDPDKFLTIDASNVVKYRTGAQLASDIEISIDDLHGAGVNGAANQLLTDDGDGTVTSESGLLWDATTLTVGPTDTTSVGIKRKDGHAVGGALKMLGANATGANQNGGALKFYGGQGTGTGDGGDIEFWTAADGTSGSSLNGFGFLPRLKIDADGDVSVGGNLQITGTIYSVGDATIFGNDIIFEGTSDDVHEATLSGGNPGSDITVTLPASTGTLALQNENTTGNADTATLAAGVVSIGNLTGDVTSSNRATTIAADAVTYAKMQNVSATNVVLGRDSAGAGVVEEISAANLRTIINVADGSNANVATNLGITGDTAARVITSSTGTNVTIPVGTTSVSGLLTPSLFDEIDANTAKNTNATHSGDVTGSGALTIAEDAVTYAKMQNLGTADRVLGSTSTGVIGETQIRTGMIADNQVTEDKISDTLLAEIDANTAKATNVVTNLSVASSTGSRVIASSDGTNATIPIATTSVSGVMSKAIFDEHVLNNAKNTNVVQTTITGNAATATSLTSGDKTISGNLIVTAGTAGDATLTLKADTDNNDEADNPYISLEQDGAGVTAQIGFSGANDEYPDASTCTGAITNALIVGATGTGAARKVQIATQNTARVTVLDTGLVGIGTNAPATTLSVNGATTTTTIELGHATDTTIARTAAGKVTIEGARIKTQELYVKILPSDFMPDDGGRPAMIDDTSGDRWLESHGTLKLFAFVEIPLGFKATLVDVYGSATSAVTVYEADVNSATVTSKGTGNIGTQINITDVTADATNYIMIELAQASGEKVYGGSMTIAAV